MKHNTLLSTVGTSFLTKFIYPPKNSDLDWEALRKAKDKKLWVQIAKSLTNLDPNDRDCGAEINSVEEVRLKKGMSVANLVFLVSDTDDGKIMGEILTNYYKNRRDLDLKNIEYVVIENLQDERPKDFKTHGLRNLVRQVGKYVQRFGNENVAIDATGGYKAQIAIAVLIGQALDIPVFYKHERFSEIIAFPPLPVSFDYDILAKNAPFLCDFERGEVIRASELGELDSKLRTLLFEVDIDGEVVYELSPIGQIYLEGFRHRNPKPINLVPATKRKDPNFRDDHYPKGFKEFVKKVWAEYAWITTTNSLPYEGQSNIKGKGFYVYTDSEGHKLTGTYQDRTNFGARFRLHLTDESLKALTWAADILNRKYRNTRY